MPGTGRIQLLKAGLAAALFAIAALASPIGAANRTDPGEQSAYALEVAGLACPFCAYGIEKRLNRIDGVAAIEVEIGAGRVLVTMQPGGSLTQERAAAAVDEAGFTLRGFEEVEPDGDAGNGGE